MGTNPESMIKKAISQTIVEEMFREMGFYVLRLGEEDIANPLTQLEWFIKKCGGNFKLQKSGKEEYTEFDYLRKMPDFCIADKQGNIYFMEVKFSKTNMLNEEQVSVFDFYPETFIVLLNLEVGKNVLYLDNFEKDWKRIEGNTDHMKNSRFNVLFIEEDGEEDILHAETLQDLLKGLSVENAQPIIEKYSQLVEKWFKPAKNENQSHNQGA